MVVEQPNEPLPPGWFRVLKVGHDPKDPPEATLVLAAVAAANGMRCDGQPMDGANCGMAPTLAWIARQVGLHVSAVRRGLQHLVAVQAVRLDRGAYVVAEALRVRWGNHRQRLCVTTEIRLLGMRARPMLVAALVAGQVNQQGELRLGIAYLTERTGFPRRTLERALAEAKSCGAIHTWLVPPEWQLHLAPGPSRSGARRAAQSGARSDESNSLVGVSSRSEAEGHRKEAVPSIATGRCHHRKAAVHPSQSGARPPDPPGVPDSPPEPAAPAGETPAAGNSPTNRGAQQTKLTHKEAKTVIERWVLAFAKKGIYLLTEKYACEVAGLLDQLGRRPAVIQNQRAFHAERQALARRVIAWCPSPERLGRWLVRVSRWFGVDNLPAYLRRACEKGDPGTLLESHSKNVLGRAAEHWRDFTVETERALEGPHANAIKKITTAVGAVLGEPDDGRRARLREELRKYLEQKRPASARAALMQLVGDDPSDAVIETATEGILPLREARRLLEAG